MEAQKNTECKEKKLRKLISSSRYTIFQHLLASPHLNLINSAQSVINLHWSDIDRLTLAWLYLSTNNWILYRQPLRSDDKWVILLSFELCTLRQSPTNGFTSYRVSSLNDYNKKVCEVDHMKYVASKSCESTKKVIISVDWKQNVLIRLITCWNRSHF